MKFKTERKTMKRERFKCIINGKVKELKNSSLHHFLREMRG